MEIFLYGILLKIAGWTRAVLKDQRERQAPKVYREREVFKAHLAYRD
jgi:hypothetical protein